MADNVGANDADKRRGESCGDALGDPGDDFDVAVGSGADQLDENEVRDVVACDADADMSLDGLSDLALSTILDFENLSAAGSEAPDPAATLDAFDADELGAYNLDTSVIMGLADADALEFADEPGGLDDDLHGVDADTIGSEDDWICGDETIAGADDAAPAVGGAGLMS